MFHVERIADAPEAFGAEVVRHLEHHAVRVGHPFDFDKLAFAADADGVRVGGVYATIGYGWVFVKYLAVDEAWRGRGVGAALVGALEKAGRAASAIGVFVDTYAFQAPGFYAKLGFTEMGRLPTHDQARTRIYFQKAL